MSDIPTTDTPTDLPAPDPATAVTDTPAPTDEPTPEVATTPAEESSPVAEPDPTPAVVEPPHVISDDSGGLHRSTRAIAVDLLAAQYGVAAVQTNDGLLIRDAQLYLINH